MTSKRKIRENVTFPCGHNQDVAEDGETCGHCGYREEAATEERPEQSTDFSRNSAGILPASSRNSDEILPAFLYLGSYYNASQAEILKAQGVTRVLNTVAACQNLHPKLFNYHNLRDDNILPFDECVQYLEQSRMEKTGVLVHCMSGLNRSAAVVIAYLMRCQGWSLSQSYQWVKERRPAINLTTAVAQQLQIYEEQVFQM